MLLGILNIPHIKSRTNSIRRNVFSLLNISVGCISKGIVKDCKQIIRKLLSNVIDSFQC